MKVYFLRHGQSELNLDDTVHQDNSTPLSKQGYQQAHEVAKLFKKVPLDIIFASPYSRSAETAKVIAEKINKPLKVLNLLKERKRPTEVERKNYNNPKAVKIKKIIRENYNNPNFKYSDEETFFEIKKRAQDLFSYFKKSQFENILAVTHEHLLNMIISITIIGPKLTPEQYLRLDEKVKIKNTSCLKFIYKEDAWKIFL